MPFLSRKKLFFSRKKLRVYGGMTLKPQDQDPSFAWVYAATILHPQLIGALAGLSFQEVQDFSIWICNEFYERTAALLKKARNEKMDSVREDWATLNENLMTLYFLTTYHSFRHRLQVRFLEAVSCLIETAGDDLRIGPAGIHASVDIKCHKMGDLTLSCIVRKEKLEEFHHFSKIIGSQFHQLIPQYMSAMSEERWDHLRFYTQHWLEKLGEGPNRYTEVMTKVFRLNTLCRIDLRNGFEEGNERRPEFYQQCTQMVFNETRERLQLLLGLRPGEFDISSSLSKLESGICTRYTEIQTRHLCDLWSMTWPWVLIDEFEKYPPLKSVSKSPSTLKDFKVKVCDPILDDALGSTKCDCDRYYGKSSSIQSIPDDETCSVSYPSSGMINKGFAFAPKS
ncbi:MAG: hypothetical protein ALECFALPRED_009032 [Alectoria fallacina]|uniref:Uncharacterized protein n=1 Tax=Alectoria fallacina TaxID=1903189 RepID=A0A8H3J5W2_9LECA|nr:MAG: hypothetical protein ALECFALPRED_009032 [Alectoria fallacina]